MWNLTKQLRIIRQQWDEIYLKSRKELECFYELSDCAAKNKRPLSNEQFVKIVEWYWLHLYKYWPYLYFKDINTHAKEFSTWRYYEKVIKAVSFKRRESYKRASE